MDYRRKREIIASLAHMGLPHEFRTHFERAADIALATASACDIKEVPDAIATLGYYTTFIKAHWSQLAANIAAASLDWPEEIQVPAAQIETDARALLDELGLELVISLMSCGCQSRDPKAQRLMARGNGSLYTVPFRLPGQRRRV